MKQFKFSLLFIFSLLLLSTRTARAAEILCPDLIAWAKPGAYVHDAEITHQAGRKLLRFSSAVANQGRGPLEMRREIESGSAVWYQHCRRSDGAVERRRLEKKFFTVYKLRRWTAGNRLGAYLASSSELPYSVWDTTAYDLSLPAASQTAVYRRAPQDDEGVEGISVGWAEVFNKSLNGQEIDITGVGNGFYWVEVKVDPSDSIKEIIENNNTAWVKIEIQGNNVTTFPDSPDFSEEPPSQSPPGNPGGLSHGGPIQAYPNPWRVNEHRGVPLRFVPLAADDIVEIYTLSGRLVRKLSPNDGTAAWDLNGENGESASSGLYFYIVKGANGIKKRGRLGVIK